MVIPNLFQKTDPALLPDKLAYEMAIGWQWNPVGLWLYGPSGSGKSRTAYSLLQKLDRETVIVTGNQFQREIVERTKPGAVDDLDDWLADLIYLDVVYFDDVSKIRFSDRTEAEFHAVLDARATKELPTIYTSELTVDRFGERLSDSNRAGIIRRIKQFCQPISFSQPQ
jgi:DNA replication protein DnaC